MSNLKQCKSNDNLKELQCQGQTKHDGPHWAYDPRGWLIRWANKRDKNPLWKSVACEWTPPGHARWISPLEMDKYCYMTLRANELRLKRKIPKKRKKANKNE